MTVILIYRPNVDNESSPFSGIEILEVTLRPEDADTIIKSAQLQYPKAHFHIDTI